MTDWLTIFDRYGFPGLIIGLMAFAIYMLGRWLAPRAERLIDTHLALLTILQEFFTGAGKDISVIKQFATNIDQKVQHMDVKVGDLDGKVGAISQRVDRMSTVMVQMSSPSDQPPA
jgi:hypothetical protein